MNTLSKIKFASVFVLVTFVAIAAALQYSTTYAVTCGFGTDIGGGVCRGYLTSGNSWPVPSDWNSSNNTIEVIGGGGGGYGCYSNVGNGAGGGGAYSKVTNVPLTPDLPVAYAVGSGGSARSCSSSSSLGGDTYFCNSTSNCASIAGTAVVVGAKGGSDANGTSGGAGGPAASGVGTVKYSGGNGANGFDAFDGGGGGGAGGPNGNGNAGSGTTGGDGDGVTTPPGGVGGVLGNPAGAGGSGAEWSSSPLRGSGGGGGGGDNQNSLAGMGGNYGGGGGGGGEEASSGGSGAPGIIVITYTTGPGAPTVTTDAASNFTSNSATLNGNITATGGEAGAGTQHGFAYSTDSTLTTGVSTTTLGTYAGTGVFSDAAGSLSPGTTYYVRAYAANSAGTGFGDKVIFTTTQAAYVVGTPSSATITIVDDDNNPPPPVAGCYGAADGISCQLGVTPSYVRKGATATVTWDVTGLAANNTCTVDSTPAVSATPTTLPASWDQVGSLWSGNTVVIITAQTRFTLTCTGTGPDTSASKTVNLLPSFQEI